MQADEDKFQKDRFQVYCRELSQLTKRPAKMLEIDKLDGEKVSTRAIGEIQNIMWAKNIICFLQEIV